MRVNRNGILYSLSADRLSSVNLDPVEKKPLYHFLPGTTTLSLGTPGCNMTCVFCQNHSLSQGQTPPFANPADTISPDLAARAVETASNAGAASLSFTYNEPLINPEMLAALAPAAKEAGLATILVSNGFASKQSMTLLRGMVDAANFDLKSFSDDFYAALCGARLAPVLKTIVRARESGWWVELTTLLIPGKNDSDRELAEIARFIKENLGDSVPWHVSRFRPMFKLTDVPATPLSSIDRAVATGLAEGLHFVYAGNTPGHDTESTRCPDCGQLVLPRLGYKAEGCFDGRCPACGCSIPGVWRNV